MSQLLTTENWLQRMGESIRALRLDANTTQADLSRQAGVSESALKNLEAGRGATLTTLINVLRALRREGWLDTLRPAPVINPLLVARDGSHRQRAHSRRKSHGTSPAKR